MKARVLKFGGTSVADAGRIRRVGDIVAATLAEHGDHGPVVVVVSALGGVTDLLERLADQAAINGRHGTDLISLANRHQTVLEALGLLGSEAETAVSEVMAELDHLLRGAQLVRESSPRTRDGIFSMGERLSAAIVTESIATLGLPATLVDARELIITDDQFGRAVVDSRATEAAIRNRLGGCTGVIVVPGFIASTPDGQTTTLGRGGSDYSAALIGGALGADPIEIWTDVDGVMSADPNRVPDAFTLDELSFDELIELSHFGAKVVYAPTIHPARAKGVSLVIRNTRNPEFAGTLISEGGAPTERSYPVRGVTSLSDVALLRLEGDVMVGRSTTAERLFRALASEGIRLLMVSQSSSGHTISFAIDLANLERAKTAVGREFELEMKAGWLDELVVQEDSCCMAVVGTGMQQLSGVSGRLFATLGDAGVNVRAIAQGSSELNISFVIAREDEDDALRAVHGAFFKRRSRKARIYLAGVGRVGSELLSQLAVAAPPDACTKNGNGRRRIEVGGIANSRVALVGNGPVDLSVWRHRLEGSQVPASALVDAALDDPHAFKVFVDCTSSIEVAERYGELLDRGLSVVAANKTGFADAGDIWESLRRHLEHDAPVYFETTVGAGLPVIRTIGDLRATGDRIHRIMGVMSGTLSYVLSEVMDGKPLSSVVRDAHGRGYTEPDPRSDLSGLDVARKAVILARAGGITTVPETVPVEPLIPAIEGDLDTFWDVLPTHDASVAEKVEKAKEAGHVLSFVGEVDASGIAVGVRELPTDHPCAAARGGNNVFSIWSDRYDPSPLSVVGPGAGPGVTAAGVYADILRALAEA